jgi:glycosyltransferase involved in cell wall biosynthesis
VGVGRLGLARPFGAVAYRPYCRAIEADFAGPIFVHNNPVALPAFKESHPKALVCLWAHNEVFNTYTAREARRVAGAADRIICVSRFIADGMAARVDGIADRLKVVHNGVDTGRFRPDPAALRPGDPVILFVGRVVPEKGPDLLIRAALKIRERSRRFKVRIVGSSGFCAADPLTPYERQLRQLAEPFGDAVEFQPFVDRAMVLAEYQAASIFCAPSNWNEPVSLTVPEALASGLATVAARRGGIPEVGGDAVLYFDPPDVDELAAHLAMLLDNPAQCAAWSAKALERAALLAWDRQYAVLLAALGDPP